MLVQKMVFYSLCSLLGAGREVGGGGEEVGRSASNVRLATDMFGSLLT